MDKITREKDTIDQIISIDPWHIIEKEVHPEFNEETESIFSLGNEYMGTRGNFEEGFLAPTLEGCYIGGIYAKERQSYVWKRKGFPTFANSMINTVNWLKIYITVDEESFSMSDSDVSNYSRILDMRRGILQRSLIFKTKTGRKTELQWERIISHNDRHMGGIRLSLRPIDHNKQIKVSFILDGKKENRDFCNSIIHSRTVSRESGPKEIYIVTTIITTGQYYINRMFVDTNGLQEKTQEYFTSERTAGCSVQFFPEKNKRYIFDKIVSVWTSRDAGYPFGLIPKEEDRTGVEPEKEKPVISFLLEKSKNNIKNYYSDGYEKIRDAHVRKFSNFWEKYDVEIIGDNFAQQGIRYSIFQLFNTYQGNDVFLNIGPKGYSGECYGGRAFWDSESYCFPFYLFTNPDSALQLLEYRYSALNHARDRAKELGYNGAIYSWTTIDGTEDTGVWEYMLGEIHINAIIPYVIFLYTKITDNKTYLYKKGAEILIELSRFWASRAGFVPYRNGYVINRVMGPNEYGQCVNNNWYTNYMSKWVLEWTMDVIKEMQNSAPEEFKRISKKLDFDLKEIKKWDDVARKIILNYDEKMGVYIENDIFLSLEPICIEELDRDKDIPIERKWTIEKYQKYQMLKQPDVLLAIFLFRDRFSLKEKNKNYSFYEQRTTHGSSLSPGIHSILASEIGRHNQSYDYYLWASRLDLENKNNNTKEGLHISSMAGSWLNIVCGFGGFIYTGEMLEFSPILPPAWEKYSFKILYRESIIKVTVDKEKSIFQVISGANVRAKVYGEDILITLNPTPKKLPLCFLNRPKLEAVIFDLDGVIVNTAKFHFLAWKKISDEENIHFNESINEKLKGVSRIDSLKIIMEKRKREYSEEELFSLAEKKNKIYIGMLETLKPKDIFPGITNLVNRCRNESIKTAIYSVSKNTDFILEKLDIRNYFDAIVTGNDISRSKPDPEGFLLAAKKMEVPAANCVVIEDAFAGIEAAAKADMKSIGIGDKTLLFNADYTLSLTKFLTLEKLNSLF